MKIAFLTACLEPGCDGVGDYTRMLAYECARNGHECALISLVDKPIERSGNHDAATDSGRLRLSAVLPWEIRIERAQRLLNRFDPDWVSLQFVSYGYHPNGIASGLDNYFGELIGDRALHIMFHELWIGHSERATMKERFVGTLQQFYILKMLRRLNPSSITTSIPLYAKLLRKYGYQSEVLPLFGNIPIATQPDSSWLFQDLRRKGIDIHKTNRNDFWLCGFFGSLHPAWPAEPLLTTLRQSAARNKRRLVLCSIGRMGPGKNLWKQLAATNGEHAAFVDLGEQDAQRISGFLQEIDFGVAASPYSVIGKSGTATAMAEHGVPVIVNWDDEQPSKDDDSRWHRLTPGFDVARLKRRRSAHRLADVAENFATILQANSKTVDCVL